MESLFGSLPEMLDFQRVFLQTLEDRTTSSPDYHALDSPEKLKVKHDAESQADAHDLFPNAQKSGFPRI